ncbi:hypothetical protein FisN_23Lh153 [Fistulifera solaris]|uniref:Uncharacterized protein n=1 Tax=Fistulifera solaris TaxID=1519565 RepID=A0A1Z5K4Q5_FISSO|nr:hypothetical protein FisN_23Lh153 [Fistulifera solaris]|eukprot:GAX21213.1 hypothetical protein FisN_23Lh153 [Fistulifera solaris]
MSLQSPQQPGFPSRDVLSSKQRRAPMRKTRVVTLVGVLTLVVFAQFIVFPFFLSVIVNQSNQLTLSDYTSFSSLSSARFKLPNRKADGFFNKVPIYLEKGSPTSHVHCVGENYQPNAWKQRSCRFHNLCFNTTSQEFVLFDSPREQRLAQYLRQREFLHISSALRRNNMTLQSMSLGGTNLKWGDKENGIGRLKWFPSIQDPNSIDSYYALPEWMIWLPFHSMNGANPGHLVWDDFFPIYTLLDMFQLLPPLDLDAPGFSNTFLFPMRYVLKGGKGLWASCDLRPEKTELCRKMMNKFLGLLVGKDYPYQFSTTQDFQIHKHNANGPDIVCARSGVAGIASLTDHGINKMHGWEEEDYLITHNHGRGGSLYTFRNFMMHNMGFIGKELLLHHRVDADGYIRHRIVFSQKSSDIYNRNLDFERQIQITKEFLPAAHVEGYVFRNHSLQEQLTIAHDASIFVTLCGGGAVTAMFLPAGTSVFLYYSERGGVKNNKMTYKPAMLDWDLFNAMSHLRVHWLPRDTLREEYDERLLVDLMRHELSLMDSEVFAKTY